MDGKQPRLRGASGVMCLVVAAVCAAVAGGPPAHAAQEAAPARAEPAPPPEAFKRVCVRCHASDRVVEGRRSRSQWEELVDQMAARGATGSDEDFEAVLEYLTTEYGRVNVNTAPAPEIALVMHLDAEAAERIVQYRASKGRFSDFEALTAVPGVPLESLQIRREALAF